MESVWQKTAERKRFDSLAGSRSCDVLIIGGGIAGLLCAYKLRQSGVDCILIEADGILSGITKNTTAKVTLQHGLIYSKLISHFGVDRARLYLEAQERALREYVNLCSQIECDFEKSDSYVYSLRSERSIQRELDALSRLGCEAEYSDASELPFTVAGAVRIRNQAKLHPLKLGYALASGLPVYERTKALELMHGRVVTDRGEVKCKKIIVATHFPILNKHGGYFIKMYQHRSYVIALEGVPPVSGMYVDEAKDGLSFRDYQGLLLLGGGSHRTGKRGGGWEELSFFAREHYKGARVVSSWATQDCMTLDGVPYIGQYSRATPDLFVATGFNKWGMTSAMVAADILTDLVRGRSNEYASLFSPSRTSLRPQLAVNLIESTVGLLTPTAPRCPHLGCALKYNAAEHSWDCPCHGSRFSQDGALIDNPATDDKRSLSKRRG